MDGSSEAGSGPGGASALLDPATGERLAVTPGGKGVPVPGMPAPACAGGSRRKRWREGGGGEAGDGAARGLAIVGLVVCWSHTEATLLLFGDAGSGGSGSKSSSSSSASSGSSDRRRNGEDGRVDGKLGAETARAGCMSGQGSGVRSGDRALEGARGPGCAAASGGSGSRLWGAVCEMLSYGGSCKVCWQAEAQLAALMAAGCTAGGQWDDPRVMAWMAQGSTSLQVRRGDPPSLCAFGHSSLLYASSAVVVYCWEDVTRSQLTNCFLHAGDLPARAAALRAACLRCTGAVAGVWGVAHFFASAGKSLA